MKSINTKVLALMSVLLFFVTACEKNDVVQDEYDTAPGKPRSMAASNGKIYMTFYTGYVAQFDTTSLSFEKTLKVGNNPEGIAIANNKIYVANSGGMASVKDSTISVIDPSTFSVLRNIKTVINPQKIEVDAQGDLYVISNGNYGNIPVTLQRIEAGTEKVTSIPGFTPFNMSLNGDFLYMFSYEYDASWNVVNKKYIKYDVKNEVIANSSFISSNSIAKVPFSIDVDPVSKDIFIAESDYVNSGKMYCFANDGTFKYSFTTGLNSAKTIFLGNNQLMVLDQGKFGSNNSTLTKYDVLNQQTINNYFESINKKGLGDTGQDMIKYGSKIYVAVYNSSVIHVIDSKTGSLIKTIPAEIKIKK